MKRWILRILICLILGAITTVAVASISWLFRTFPYWGENSFEVRAAFGALPVDLLVCSLLWSGVLFALDTVRDVKAAERGRCPRCGYDLRANLAAGCSECGWGRIDAVIPKG